MANQLGGGNYEFLVQASLPDWCHTWEEDPTKGAAAEQISALFDREENERQPPFGQALDLGCGSGIWSVQLAVRGWQVTGVDIVSKAIRQAQKQAKTADAEVRFIRGDVTALRAAGIEPGYQFIVDFVFQSLKRSAAQSGWPRGECNRSPWCYDAYVGLGTRSKRAAATWCKPQRDRDGIPTMEHYTRGWLRCSVSVTTVA